MSQSIFRWLSSFGQGIVHRCSHVIPGVSGGTMALIFGIYEQLIGLLGDLFKAGLLLLKLDFRGFSEKMSHIPWGIFPLAYWRHFNSSSAWGQAHSECTRNMA